MSGFRRYTIGDSSLCWALGETMDRDVSRKVLAAWRILKRALAEEPGFLDLVPSYTSLAVYLDPLACSLSGVSNRVEAVLGNLGREGQGGNLERPETVHRLMVRYDGVDLERVARHSGLTVREVIDRHKAPLYTVAMIGFLPYFPYLIGLDSRLETPRLASPRTKVPAGSVAIGGAQTGVYPSESPGGWNILGTTDPDLLKRIHPGDGVLFIEET